MAQWEVRSNELSGTLSLRGSHSLAYHIPPVPRACTFAPTTGGARNRQERVRELGNEARAIGVDAVRQKYFTVPSSEPLK